MFNRKYVALSYYQRQIKESINRRKALAELESQLILTDIKNNDLTKELTHLQMENNLLKSKLHTQVAADSKRKQKQTALERANQYLRNKKKLADSSQTCSDLRLPLKVNRSYHLDSSCIRNKQSRANFSYLPQSQLKLSKAVYYNESQQIDHSQHKSFIKQSLPYHKRQFSFKQKEEMPHLNQLKLSQSHGVIQRSRQLGSKAISRFEEKQQQKMSEQLKRWKSDGNFVNQSQMIFGSDAFNQPKRKTFLSIVSVSSISKKV